MKLTFTLFTILATLFFTGCKEEFGTLTIDHSSSSAEFVIAKGTPQGTVKQTSKVDVDLDKIAADNGVDANKYKSLKIQSAKVISTNGKTYDEFESVKIAVMADGLSKKTVFLKNPVPTGQSSINLDVDPNDDLLPYFKGTNLVVEFEGVSKSMIAEDINTKVELTYKLEVEVIK